MAVDRVRLASPRGFCAGVEKAIKALDWMVRVFEPPVFCYHEIVHNRYVVEHFERQGVVFVDDVASVPLGAPVMLSAHGSPPEVVAAARARGGVVIDAVCPLVTKVHHELKVRAEKGYEIVYVGHAGHEEAVGTMAVAPSAVHLVERPEDVDALEGVRGPVAFLSQTTLSYDEFAEVRDRAAARFAGMWTPNRSDLCFATTNRQRALRAVAEGADAVVVIGSSNSSNTIALEKVARAVGCPVVLRVNGASELPSDLRGVVGVTAGASAPEAVVDAVLAALAPRDGVEVLHAVDEDEYFPPPPELRELLRSLARAVAVLGDARQDPGDPVANDRQMGASEVLVGVGA